MAKESKTKRPRSFLRPVIVIFGVLALFFLVFVRPWYAEPEPMRVDLGWKNIVGAAREGLNAPREADETFAPLAKAAVDAKGDLNGLSEDLRLGKTIESVPPGIEKVLEALDRWHVDSGGGTARPGTECPDPTSIERATVRLGVVSQVAFRAKTGISEDRVAAFVKLAARHRRTGDLMAFYAGTEMLGYALEWLDGHRALAAGMLREYGIAPVEVRAAIAREVVCNDATLEAWQQGKGFPMTGWGADADDVPFYARRVFNWSREARMLRIHWGERLGPCTVGADLTPFLACISRPPDESLKSGAVRRLTKVHDFKSVSAMIDRQRTLLEKGP